MSFIREIAYHQRGRVPDVEHAHKDSDSLEIIQILAGDGNAIIDENTYPLAPGTLLFIDSAHIHSLNPQDVNDYCRNKLIVRRSLLEKALQPVSAMSLLDLFGEVGGSCFTLSPEQAGEVDNLFCIMSVNAGDNALIFSQLIRLLVTPEPQNQQFAVAGDERVSRVLHYLHTRYAEPITIDDLTVDVHVSKYYLCRLFRNCTGMSIIQYLNEQRLAASRRMLVQTRRSITEVAQDCGFGNASHFCAMFREHEGTTPRRFRLNNSK